MTYVPKSANTFLVSPDTPANYAGAAGDVATVNGGETALVFLPGGGGSTTFLALSDTPGSFVGQSTKVVSVNVGETALEFTVAGGGGGLPSLALNTEVSSGRSVGGQPTFFKVVASAGALPASTTTLVAHGIAPLIRVITAAGVCLRDNGSFIPMPNGDSSDTFAVVVQVDATNVLLFVGSAWTGAGNLLSAPWIVLEYTKT